MMFFGEEPMRIPGPRILTDEEAANLLKRRVALEIAERVSDGTDAEDLTPVFLWLNEIAEQGGE